DQDREHAAVDPGRWLDYVRQVALANDVVEIGEIPARGLLMRGQVKIAARGDALQLGPSEGKFILDVEGAAGIMRQLVLVMRAQTQVLAANAQRQVPLEPLLLPVLQPLHLLGGWDEILELHLLELAQAEDRVAGGDLVAKGLADLGDAEGRPHPGGVEDVGEVDENALRGSRPQVDLRA